MKKQINIIRNYLKEQHVVRAYLFGSSVRNEAAPDSDLDLLLEPGPDMNLFSFAKMKLQLEELLEKRVDLVSENGLSPHIKPFIDQEKILIYEK
jgi:predicted nucleotidyltransferase